MVDEPENHRDIDVADLKRSTKAYACTCAAHQQWQCAYHRMGYCQPKNHGEQPPFKKPTLVHRGPGNVYKLEKVKPKC